MVVYTYDAFRKLRSRINQAPCGVTVQPRSFKERERGSADFNNMCDMCLPNCADFSEGSTDPSLFPAHMCICDRTRRARTHTHYNVRIRFSLSLLRATPDSEDRRRRSRSNALAIAPSREFSPNI